jgi:hypothetical protein
MDINQENNDEVKKSGDLSNKTLANILTIVVIVSLVSLGATMVSISRISHMGLTGLAAGQVNLSISNSTGCNIDYNVTFGVGIPTATVILSTNTSSGAAYGFNDCTAVANPSCYYGMQINNTGNTWLNVTMQSSANASSMLDPAANWTNFIWYAQNGTLKNGGASNGCMGSAQIGTFGYVNSSNTTNICFNLSYVNGADIVSIGWNITINQTTPKTGIKNASITITCAQSSQT